MSLKPSVHRDSLGLLHVREEVYGWTAGKENDVGFPSVCCEYVLLSLVNKDATLACGRAEQNVVGKLNGMLGEGRQSQREVMQPPKDRHLRALPVNHEAHGKIQNNGNLRYKS